jgi:MFS family permease
MIYQALLGVARKETMSSSSGPKTHSEMLATNSRPKSYFTMRITIAASLVFLVFVFNDSSWGPLLVPLADQLHISLVMTGLFYVFWSTGYLPGALAGGAMLDRYGPLRVFTAAVLWVFCSMLCILVGLFLPREVPVWVLLGLAGLAGIGGGVIDAITNGLISTIYIQKRGAALNLFNLLYPLGGLIVALIVAGLLAVFHNDPRPAFLFTLGFALVALISLPGVPMRFVSTEPVDASRESHIETSHRVRSLIVLLAPVIAVMMLTAGISSSVRAWAPVYLHVAFAQTPAIASALSSITWALAALSRLGAAGLILYIGSWRVIMLGLLISLGGLVILLLSANAILATIAIAVVSIGLSPILATCLTIASERAGWSLGSVAGLLLFVGGISTVFCGWFFGLLLNTSGPTSAVLFCLLFTVLGTLMALRLRSTL